MATWKTKVSYVINSCNTSSVLILQVPSLSFVGPNFILIIFLSNTINWFFYRFFQIAYFAGIFFYRERKRKGPSRCPSSNLYNILCTINTQHTSRRDSIITIKLYFATCFGRGRPSSGQLKTILMYS